MFDGEYYRSEFKDRMSSAESLLDATSVSPGDIPPLDVSRETGATDVPVGASP